MAGGVFLLPPFFCYAAANRESSRNIEALGFRAQSGLSLGAAGAAQQARLEGGAELARDLAGDPLRLVVAAPQAPHPVKRDRHHQVHILKQRRSCEASPEHSREVPACRKVAPILQRARYRRISRLRPVVGKRRRLLIRLIQISLLRLMSRKNGHQFQNTTVFATGVRIFGTSVAHVVVLIGHRVMLPEFEAGEGQVHGAGEAQEALAKGQRPATRQTDSRHQQICQCRERGFEVKFKQAVVHGSKSCGRRSVFWPAGCGKRVLI